MLERIVYQNVITNMDHVLSIAEPVFVVVVDNGSSIEDKKRVIVGLENIHIIVQNAI